MRQLLRVLIAFVIFVLLGSLVLAQERNTGSQLNPNTTLDPIAAQSQTMLTYARAEPILDTVCHYNERYQFARNVLARLNYDEDLAAKLKVSIADIQLLTQKRAGDLANRLHDLFGSKGPYGKCEFQMDAEDYYGPSDLDFSNDFRIVWAIELLVDIYPDLPGHHHSGLGWSYDLKLHLGRYAIDDNGNLRKRWKEGEDEVGRILHRLLMAEVPPETLNLTAEELYSIMTINSTRY